VPVLSGLRPDAPADLGEQLRSELGQVEKARAEIARRRCSDWHIHRHLSRYDHDISAAYAAEQPNTSHNSTSLRSVPGAPEAPWVLAHDGR
jgi:hypothetical protein